jgi:hypothetical protein
VALQGVLEGGTLLMHAMALNASRDAFAVFSQFSDHRMRVKTHGLI